MGAQNRHETRQHRLWAGLLFDGCDLLIEFFDNGLLAECDNGVTLRSFLSRKLHCSPMRISKKYAGKCLRCIAMVVFASTVLTVSFSWLDLFSYRRQGDWQESVSVKGGPSRPASSFKY